MTDHGQRGREIAALFFAQALPLLAELEHSEPWRRAVARADAAPSGTTGAASARPSPSAASSGARVEWEIFALYACVRGLIAGGGFNRETEVAMDALHETVMERWAAAGGGDSADRRALVSERYAEYGTIGHEGGASGAATVTARLGAAAAAHMLGADAAPDVAIMVGDLHEALAEVVADQVRGG